MLGSVEGDDADAEVRHQLDGEGEHVVDALVLEAAVADAHGRVGVEGAGRQPVDAGDRLVADLQREAALHHRAVACLVEDLHVLRPPWRCGRG